MVIGAVYVGAALIGGLLAVLLRLPPLVGYLAAGFVLAGLGVEDVPALQFISDLGVVLLLYGIGLKFDLKTLFKPQVWAAAGLHMLVSTALGTAALSLVALAGSFTLRGTGVGTFCLIAFALSFSSTVFVASLLEQRSDTTSLYGRIAVAILVIQDIAAIAVLSLVGGAHPSWWALTLLGLPILAIGLRKVLDHLRHGQLQLLFGAATAFIPGYVLFEAVGLSGDLGALVMGLLMASHARAHELSESMVSIKDLLLVGFFLDIGASGIPTLGELRISLVLVALLPLQCIAYVWVFWAMRVRKRTAVLGGFALSNYSEFALIVVAVDVTSGVFSDAWEPIVAVTVALSFVFGAIINRRESPLFRIMADHLPSHRTVPLHPEDRPIDLSGAEALVLGVGRVGHGAFEQLSNTYGLQTVGIDADPDLVATFAGKQERVIEADATDIEFWHRVVQDGGMRIAILALPVHEANLFALEQLVASDFEGTVAVVAHFPEEVPELLAHGADTVFQVYDGAGTAIADAAVATDEAIH